MPYSYTYIPSRIPRTRPSLVPATSRRGWGTQGGEGIGESVPSSELGQGSEGPTRLVGQTGQTYKVIREEGIR